MTRTSRLAIHGGNPVRDKYLPYGKQWLEDDDIHAVLDVLKEEYITTGPTIAQFEKIIADYVGTTYAVAFSSGTAALHGACCAAGIASGDEVITSPITFVASANCILYQRGKPVFADIHPQTYNIDPQAIKAHINKKTKAIIPVDFAGQPADLEQISHIAKEHHLIVIEDAAHALGATYKGRKVGSLSDMTMFSFHPVKHITTGEGGIITTNNKDFYDSLLKFRNHGITRNPNKFCRDEGPWYYEMQFLGYNYRMTDIQAALGISQWKKLECFIERRKRYVNMYNEAFQEMKQLSIPYQSEHSDSSWHLYIIRLRLEHISVGRKEIFNALLKENIGVQVHYIPVYLQPYYQQLGYKKDLCPQAEKLYQTIITLPLFPAMSASDVEDVIKAVKKVIAYYSI